MLLQVARPAQPDPGSSGSRIGPSCCSSVVHSLRVRWVRCRYSTFEDAKAEIARESEARARGGQGEDSGVRVLVLCRVLMGKIYVSGETIDRAMAELRSEKASKPGPRCCCWWHDAGLTRCMVRRLCACRRPRSSTLCTLQRTRSTGCSTPTTCCPSSSCSTGGAHHHHQQP